MTSKRTEAYTRANTHDSRWREQTRRKRKPPCLRICQPTEDKRRLCGTVPWEAGRSKLAAPSCVIPSACVFPDGANSPSAQDSKKAVRRGLRFREHHHLLPSQIPSLRVCELSRVSHAKPPTLPGLIRGGEGCLPFLFFCHDPGEENC